MSARSDYPRTLKCLIHWYFLINQSQLTTNENVREYHFYENKAKKDIHAENTIVDSRGKIPEKMLENKNRIESEIGYIQGHNLNK